MLDEQSFAEALAPFPSRFVEWDGRRVHFIAAGQGTPLLCLHPAPGWCLLYKRLLLELRDCYQVIAPDFPGFGLSESDGPLSLSKLRAFVPRFLDQLGLESATLLVFDSSGPIGLGAAVDDPTRFSALIILDTFAFPLTGRMQLARFMPRRVLPLARSVNRRCNLLPWLVSTFACYKNPLSSVERRAYQRGFPAAARDRLVDWFFAAGDDRQYLVDLEQQIGARLTNHPSLLIYGQFDPMRFLGAPRRFRQLLPRAELQYISFEEHFPVLGSARQVARVIHAWRTRNDGAQQAQASFGTNSQG